MARPSGIAPGTLPTMESVKHRLSDRLRQQSEASRALGSPLYAELLKRAAQDVEAGGPTLEILRGHGDDTWESMLPLRLMGSVHRLALDGDAPALAAQYVSANADPRAVWPEFLEVLKKHPETLRDLIRRPVQTNEVGRSAILLGGFVLVAAETGLPLRCLEVGASAGLNLRWDRYRYESDGASWGDPGSEVRFGSVFQDAVPPTGVSMVVSERRGCDLRPVDPTTREGQLTLRSYVWPDQVERVERLNAALEVAGRVPAIVDEADALEWIKTQLASPSVGQATIIFHSITALYFESEYRRRFREAIELAGKRAIASAPLAWLSLELEGDRFETRLRVWPGGEERLIALSGPHGPPVRWLEGSRLDRSP
jgi:hypothetical protein